MKTIQEITKKEISDFRNEITRTVHDMFMQEKALYPVVFGMKYTEEKVELFALEGLVDFTENDITKLLMVEAIKQFNQKTRPISIAFASEGYLRSFTPLLDEDGEIIEELRSLATEIEEEKKEVLFINFETYDQESIIYWEIIRDEDNEVVDLKLLIDKQWQTKTEENKGNVARMLNENYSTLATKVKEEMLQSFNMN